LTLVDVVPTLVSSWLAEVIAAVYAATNASISSEGTGPGRTTKPRSVRTETASPGSELSAANVLNQSRIVPALPRHGLTTRYHHDPDI
jgi:hypothetical protein